jgi:hypothetical protein
MKRIYTAITSLALFGLTTSIGLADSISPTSYSATLGVGESVTIRKTVTVSEGAPTSSKVDVVFLADETGSMGSYIAAVETAAASIVSSTSALGDVMYGVSGYRDSLDAFTYRQIADLTTGAGAVAAIPTWTAGGGGDYPEAGMFGLNEVSTGTSWRTGSERLIVWFGDAPADDPDVGGVTQASLIAELNSKGISVLAVNVGTVDLYAPSGVGHRGLNDKDQASAIAAGTGGTFYDGINASSIADTIADAITTAVSTYTSVDLDISEAPAGVSVSYTPAAGHLGAFDRSIERTFDFDLTFTGVAPGDYSFDIYGTVDGGRVATEADRIRVLGATGVPDGGSSMLLLGAALTGLGLVRRKLRR